MTDAERAVWRLLHRGRPCTRDELERFTGFDDRKVRAAIRGLVVRHHRPIVSIAGAYKLAESRRELEKYCGREEPKARSIDERVFHLRRAFEAFHEGQGALGFDQAAASRARHESRCVVCGKPLEGRQERYCSDKHKDVFHGRRAS